MLENEIIYVPQMEEDEFRYPADDGEDLSALSFAVHPSAGCLAISVASLGATFHMLLIGWEQVGSYPLFVYMDFESEMMAYIISPDFIDHEFGWRDPRG